MARTADGETYEWNEQGDEEKLKRESDIAFSQEPTATDLTGINLKIRCVIISKSLMKMKVGV